MTDTILNGTPEAKSSTAPTGVAQPVKETATQQPTTEAQQPTGDVNATTAADTEASTDSSSETESSEQPTGQGDWATIRAKVAGDDEKILNVLSQYSTLEDALKAGVEARRKLSSGQQKTAKVPDANSSPEEIKAYREANGIPEEAKDYKVELPDGVVLGDADKPVADKFLEIAHKHNLPPAVANDIIANQLKIQQEYLKEQEEADDQARADARAKLTSNEVWGSEAQLNINMINNMLEGAPQGVKENLLDARLGDGTLLGNNVPALRWLSNLARELNPYGTITPNQGMSLSETVQAEMAKLEGMMGDRNSAYWKGPTAQQNQQRYGQLLEAKLNAEKRQ